MNRASLRHGVVSALVPVGLLWLALLPARLSVAMRVRGGTGFERLSRAAAGSIVDLAAVAPVVCALVLVVAVGVWVASARRRAPHAVGPPPVPLLVVAPLALLLGVVALIQQEVKAERGAFPTLAEVLANGGNASFMEGVVGFVRYERMWVPVALCALAAGAVMVTWRRRGRGVGPVEPRGWALGLMAGLAAGAMVPRGVVEVQSRVSHRLSPGALSAPLDALVESTVDLVSGRPPPKPAALLRHLPFTPADVEAGAARLGWPMPGARGRPHPHARELEGEAPAPAAPLVEALRRVSRALFTSREGPVAVFQVSLESFRGADLHALEPAAPRALTPVVSGLYEAAHRPGSGVLASTRTWQAGVRTAQGLAAMTCGLGTLPWNLALIRDVDAFPMRCAPDVLAAAGFEGSFFYGSDASYDGMRAFATAHGLGHVVSQDELPAGSPKGAWGGVSDFAVFDAAVEHVAQGLSVQRSQLAMVLSLSNHSPFTVPDDAPHDLDAQVDAALAQVPHRATADDRRRLVTHAYTDRAVQRLFDALERRHLDERSLVVLAADHSTGTDYVWGPASADHETDVAKANIPFLIVVPQAFRQHVADVAELDAALADAQTQLDARPISQNDVPALLLALLSAQPGVVALPASERWHTLGGQATSPFFRTGGEGEALMGINGVDEFYALDAEGKRVGPYEDAVALQTVGDATRVTPRLIPIAATLVETLDAPRSTVARP